MDRQQLFGLEDLDTLAVMDDLAWVYHYDAGLLFKASFAD
jgi:hypothetical protein